LDPNENSKAAAPNPYTVLQIILFPSTLEIKAKKTEIESNLDSKTK
jgi:hypothetical protein